MNTLKRITLILGAIAIIITMTIAATDNSTTTLVSTKGCCSITTQQVGDYEYQVTWTDNNTLDTQWTEHVEVEYPDADYTMEEQIAYELDWTLSEMKELCFTYHK